MSSFFDFAAKYPPLADVAGKPTQAEPELEAAPESDAVPESDEAPEQHAAEVAEIRRQLREGLDSVDQVRLLRAYTRLCEGRTRAEQRDARREVQQALTKLHDANTTRVQELETQLAGERRAQESLRSTCRVHEQALERAHQAVGRFAMRFNVKIPVRLDDLEERLETLSSALERVYKVQKAELEEAQERTFQARLQAKVRERFPSLPSELEVFTRWLVSQSKDDAIGGRSVQEVVGKYLNEVDKHVQKG